MIKRGTILCVVALLAGCSSPGGSGVRWYAPTTWFSGSEGRSVERAEERVDEQREALLGVARDEALKAEMALLEAEPSRPVEIASRTLGNATTALNQVVGPITVEQVTLLRETVAGLLSEEAQARERAERAQRETEERLSDASTRLSELQGRLAEREQSLQAAFARENALANKLRAWQWGLVWVGVALILFAALAVWWRIQGLGLLSGITRSLKDADVLGLGSQFRQVLDVNLSRAEQEKIARLVRQV